MSDGRSEWRVNWRALLLLPVLIPMALLAGLFGKSARRTPDEVASYLRDFIEGRSGEWDWDDFESVPIADPALDHIRREAALVGPPDANMTKLRELLAKVEAMSEGAVKNQPTAPDVI